MSKCKSCGAEIIWIKMISGRSMPVDAKPVMFEEGTADVIVLPNGTVERGRICDTGSMKGYTSHFATCPFASQHRRMRNEKR